MDLSRLESINLNLRASSPRIFNFPLIFNSTNSKNEDRSSLCFLLNWPLKGEKGGKNMPNEVAMKLKPIDHDVESSKGWSYEFEFCSNYLNFFFHFGGEVIVNPSDLYLRSDMSNIRYRR